MPLRRTTRLPALAVLALALGATLAGPAPALDAGEASEAAQHFAACDTDALALHARVDARVGLRPPAPPGLQRAPLPAAPRWPARADALAACPARSDPRTLAGWCLAHSTATALS